MSDLVVLVADKPMESVVQALLARPEALGIRSGISTTFSRHSDHDSGVRTTGPELLRTVARQHEHALLVCDFEGSGTSKASAIELESQLDGRLVDSWETKAKSIVIHPELDIWMWGSDANLMQTLSWTAIERPRSWLKTKGHDFDENGKPVRPKEALEAVFRQLRLPYSAALYARIAMSISLARCTDCSFVRLRKILTTWFPAD